MDFVVRGGGAVTIAGFGMRSGAGAIGSVIGTLPTRSSRTGRGSIFPRARCRRVCSWATIASSAGFPWRTGLGHELGRHRQIGVLAPLDEKADALAEAPLSPSLSVALGQDGVPAAEDVGDGQFQNGAIGFSRHHAVQFEERLVTMPSRSTASARNGGRVSDGVVGAICGRGNGCRGWMHFHHRYSHRRRHDLVVIESAATTVDMWLPIEIGVQVMYESRESVTLIPSTRSSRLVTAWAESFTSTATRVSCPPASRSPSFRRGDGNLRRWRRQHVNQDDVAGDGSVTLIGHPPRR